MELKHLIIAAIVANAAKSGRPAAPGSTPALTIAIPEDARPSYGAFASLTKCLESPPALCREDRKKTTSAVFHLLIPILFAVPLPATVVSAHSDECFGNTCLGYVMAPARNRAGEKCNPLRIQRAAAPNFQGYVQGGDVQPSDRVAPNPPQRPTQRAMSGQGPEQTPWWRPRTTG